MEEIFIKNIHINKVRHLENIDIPISETERKHLILTGKNGSGKTSVLLEIKKLLELTENDLFLRFKDHKLAILSTYALIYEVEQSIKQLEVQKLTTSGNDLVNLNHYIKHQFSEINTHKYNINSFKTSNEDWLKLKSIFIDIDYNSYEISELYKEGNFILTYFGARRNLQINVPKGISKIEIKDKYNINENAGKEFLQHLVNLKADRLFAREENDELSVSQIDLWFESFEKSLQEVFDEPNLKLEFDRKKYNFNIVDEGKEVSDLTVLSDGYSAIFNFISELIMRMENKASKSYDIQGIVLIDEIETHLHIDLQKKILPFLTNFFPKIQFIVTTHSPFVLNSVNNAVIFDLEKKLLVEDLSGYSVNSIIESYFDSDDYSTIVKEKVIEYERLLTADILNEEEEEKLFDLKRYFKDLPKMFSPELALKINQLQLANLAVK